MGFVQVENSINLFEVSPVDFAPRPNRVTRKH